jgi:hypothetical protein
LTMRRQRKSSGRLTKGKMPRTIRELIDLVGREPVDVQVRRKWVVCSFEPESVGAVITVLLPK